MKNLTLYNEIKAAVRESMEADHNAKEWAAIAREKLADAKTIISAAKKVNKGVEIDAKALLDFIKADLAEEMAPASEPVTNIPANNAPKKWPSPTPKMNPPNNPRYYNLARSLVLQTFQSLDGIARVEGLDPALLTRAVIEGILDYLYQNDPNYQTKKGQDHESANL